MAGKYKVDDLFNRHNTEPYIRNFWKRVFTHVLFNGKHICAGIWEKEVTFDQLLMGIDAARTITEPAPVGFGQRQFNPLGGIFSAGLPEVHEHKNIGIPVIRCMPQVEVDAVRSVGVCNVYRNSYRILIPPLVPGDGGVLIHYRGVITGRKEDDNRKNRQYILQPEMAKR